jgi:hypothetical protein
LKMWTSIITSSAQPRSKSTNINLTFSFKLSCKLF